MSVVFTSSLHKNLDQISTSTSHNDWVSAMQSSLRKNQEGTATLIANFKSHIDILEHQKARCSDSIAVLEELGGLTIRARNFFQSSTDPIKKETELKEFELWFRRAMEKLDKTAQHSTYHGINLLNGGTLSTPTDSAQKNMIVTNGMILDSKTLELKAPDFSTVFSIQNSRVDVMNAIDMVVTLRNMIASHLSALQVSLDCAYQSIQLADEACGIMDTSQMEQEVSELRRLHDLGTNVLSADSLAEPAQQEILKSFASSPTMEDL